MDGGWEVSVRRTVGTRQEATETGVTGEPLHSVTLLTFAAREARHSLRSSSPPGGSPNRRRRGNRRVRGEMHGGKSRVRWDNNHFHLSRLLHFSPRCRPSSVTFVVP